MPQRPCIYFKLNLCEAPCIDRISQSTYRENLDHIIQFLKGNKKIVIQKLKKQMAYEAHQENFEKASELRNQLFALENVALHKNIIESHRSRKSQHMKELQEVLQLPKLPKRIEGFDSSHFHGDSAVVSMVVFENGKSQTKYYRRFKITAPPEGGDDFYNLNQALSRRFQRQDWPIPDLILIDGGKGQLQQALKAQENGLIHYKSIPIISLAKKEELIFTPTLPSPLKLPRSSKALQLLQSIRDESHRFAITYHKKLREEMPMKALNRVIPKK